MDSIEDCHGRIQTFVTFQIPVANWHEIIGEGVIANTIIEKLVYSSHRLELTGESLQKERN